MKRRDLLYFLRWKNLSSLGGRLRNRFFCFEPSSRLVTEGGGGEEEREVGRTSGGEPFGSEAIVEDVELVVVESRLDFGLGTKSSSLGGARQEGPEASSAPSFPFPSKPFQAIFPPPLSSPLPISRFLRQTALR